MQLFIRYNAPEGRFTKNLMQDFDGYLISGPHAEYYSNAFSNLVRETEKPFVIDPHTHDLKTDKKSDTKYYNKLDIGSKIDRIAEPAVRREVFSNILTFQFNRVNEQLQEDPLEEVSKEFRPTFLIAPYGVVSERTDLAKTTTDIALAKELRPDEKVYAEIVITKETLLRPLTMKRITSAFVTSKADGFCFSVVDFKAEIETVDLLMGYKIFVEQVGASRKPVIALHGSFFDLLLASKGLTGIVHGVDTGDKLVLGDIGGGRRAPPRYYVYALKKRFVGSDLDFIKSKAPELLNCDCESCKTKSNSRNELLPHYIHMRRKEVDEVNAGKDQLSQVKISLQKYRPILEPAINLNYLKNWTKVLS